MRWFGGGLGCSVVVWGVLHINTGKHQNTGKQPKYRKAHINTKRQGEILVR